MALYRRTGRADCCICSRLSRRREPRTRPHAAASSAQKDAVAAQVDSQAQASSDARTTMLDYLASIPTIEARSNEAAERVRIIYRDSPAVCVADRPARVQSKLTRPIALQPPPSVPCDSPTLAVPPMVPEPAQMDVWAIRMLGLYETAAASAGATNRCLRDLRAKGVIR